MQTKDQGGGSERQPPGEASRGSSAKAKEGLLHAWAAYIHSSSRAHRLHEVPQREVALVVEHEPHVGALFGVSRRRTVVVGALLAAEQRAQLAAAAGARRARRRPALLERGDEAGGGARRGARHALVHPRLGLTKFLGLLDDDRDRLAARLLRGQRRLERAAERAAAELAAEAQVGLADGALAALLQARADVVVVRAGQHARRREEVERGGAEQREELPRGAAELLAQHGVERAVVVLFQVLLSMMVLVAWFGGRLGGLVLAAVCFDCCFVFPSVRTRHAAARTAARTAGSTVARVSPRLCFVPRRAHTCGG